MEQYTEKQSLWIKLKSFVNECIRVLKITKKPTKEEFKTISKISGLGILIIGLIGFIIHLIDVLLFK
ncbi:MAG: protein translocase SEC61 complex subunit gamma [Candidatus Woesearchaeota archaeon]